jgi:hypothetical protein
MNSSLIKFHFFIVLGRTKRQRHETHLFRNVEGSAASGRVMPTAAKHFSYHRVVGLFQTLRKKKKKRIQNTWNHLECYSPPHPLLLLPFTRPSLRIEHYWQGSDKIHCIC